MTYQTTTHPDPTTLVADFLLARIAEDEAAAAHWSADVRRRILDECKSKRRLIERAVKLDEDRHHHPITFADHGVSHAMFDVLIALTYPYRDHPDAPVRWRNPEDGP